MSIRNTFKQIPDIIFAAFGDLVENVTVDHYGSSEYDVSTGNTSIYTEREFVSMVFEPVNETNMLFQLRHTDNQNIQESDLIGMCPQSQLGDIIKVDDKVTRVEHGASVEYDVIGVHEDLANAHWALHLRRT